MAAALCGAVPGAMASNLNFLGRAPVAYFTPEDFDLARGALGRALSAEAMDTAFDWANPATRARGTITPLSAFERNGLPCRQLRIATRHPKAQANGVYTLCQREGRWKLAPSR